MGVFGVRGEVKLAAPDGEALRFGMPVLVLPEGAAVAKARSKLRSVIASARAHGRIFVVRLRGVDDADAARALHGATVLAARSDLPKLSKNEYREADLAGLPVVDARLGVLGEVREIRRYPSCDMLVVGEKKLLVPMLRAYGLEVDLATREIRVTLPPGFDELT